MPKDSSKREKKFFFTGQMGFLGFGVSYKVAYIEKKEVRGEINKTYPCLAAFSFVLDFLGFERSGGGGER